MASIIANASAAAWAELAAAFWTIRNAGEVSRGLQLLFDMQRHGGTVVQVPTAAPIIRTLIQPDGDIVTQVAVSRLRQCSPQQLAELIEQHQRALEECLRAPDPRLAEGIAAFAGMFRRVSFATPVLMGGVGLSSGAIRTFALYLVVSCVPLALRLAAPRVLRWLLRQGRLYLRRRLRV